MPGRHRWRRGQSWWAVRIRGPTLLLLLHDGPAYGYTLSWTSDLEETRARIDCLLGSCHRAMEQGEGHFHRDRIRPARGSCLPVRRTRGDSDPGENGRPTTRIGKTAKGGNEMPGFDRTGPRGLGPMTGGGRGWCNPYGSFHPGYSAYRRPFYGRARPRWGPGRRFTGRGLGLGWGRGWGRGRGRRWW